MSRLITNKRRKYITRFMRQILWPYIFISPFFILFVVFGLFPYLYTFYLSFTEWDGIGSQTWVGVENYKLLLTDSLWWQSLYNSAWLFFASSMNLILAFILAFILNNGLVKYKEFFRTAYFMPVVTSSVAVAMIFQTMFGVRYGTLNWLLSLVGLGPIDWLGQAVWVKPAISLVVIWRYFGWNCVIYLAGLQSIPLDLHDAARVDGARWRDEFWHITMPLMRPVITFTVILSIIGALQLLAEPLMLCGGPAERSPGCTGRSGMTIMVYLYITAFSYLQFGYAATISVGLFVVTVFFSFVYIRFLGKDAEE